MPDLLALLRRLPMILPIFRWLSFQNLNNLTQKFKLAHLHTCCTADFTLRLYAIFYKYFVYTAQDMQQSANKLLLHTWFIPHNPIHSWKEFKFPFCHFNGTDHNIILTWNKIVTVIALPVIIEEWPICQNPRSITEHLNTHRTTELHLH